MHVQVHEVLVWVSERSGSTSGLSLSLAGDTPRACRAGVASCAGAGRGGAPIGGFGEHGTDPEPTVYKWLRDHRPSGRSHREGPESEILARVRAGERAAYAELVVAHAPLAKRVAVLAGAGGDADDVVQEAFVKAYRSLGTFRDGSSFRPWLLRIVVNETHNQRRSSGRGPIGERRAGRLDAQSLTEPDPADEALSTARRRALLDAVSGLPAEQRCRRLPVPARAVGGGTSQVLDLSPRERSSPDCIAH